MFKFHHIVNTIWISQLMTSNIQAINIQRAPQVSTELDFINLCSFLLYYYSLYLFRHTKSVQRNIKFYVTVCTDLVCVAWCAQGRVRHQAILNARILSP